MHNSSRGSSRPGAAESTHDDPDRASHWTDQRPGERHDASGERYNASGERYNASGERYNASGERYNASGERTDASGTRAGQPTPTARRLPFRRAFALVAAGGLLAGVVGISSAATSRTGTQAASGLGSVSTQAWGNDSTTTTTWVPSGRGRYGSGSSGGALVDTVLTNGEAAGTGVVLSADGQILTNYHVVAGSSLIKVTIASTGTAYTGTVVGANPTADVALVQLENASGLTVAKIDQDTVGLGDAVTAVGNAGGTGSLSAADGTVTDLSTRSPPPTRPAWPARR